MNKSYATSVNVEIKNPSFYLNCNNRLNAQLFIKQKTKIYTILIKKTIELCYFITRKIERSHLPNKFTITNLKAFQKEMLPLVLAGGSNWMMHDFEE